MIMEQGVQAGGSVNMGITTRPVAWNRALGFAMATVIMAGVGTIAYVNLRKYENTI